MSGGRHQSEVGARASDVLHGVALEQLAAIHVDVDTGFSCEEALSVERLEAEAFATAELAWTMKLADGGAVMDAYRGAIVAHQERMARTVTPLDEELESWVAFLHRYETADAPFDLLDALGMRLADVARLGRRWRARFEASPRLGKRARRARERLAMRSARNEKVWLPVIEVGEPKLVASPFAARAMRAANRPGPDKALTNEAKALLARVTLDVYAAFVAALRVSKPGARQGVLSKMGLTPKLAAELDRHWLGRIEDDAVLRADFRVLTRHFMEATRLRSQGAEAAANHVIASLELPEPESAVAVPTSATPTPPQVSSSEGVDATAVGVPVLLLGEALPFVQGLVRAPSRAALGPAPTRVGATAIAVPALRDDQILPFGPTSAIDQTSAVMTSRLELDVLPFEEGARLDDSGLMVALDEADFDERPADELARRSEASRGSEVDATGIVVPALLDAEVLPFASRTGETRAATDAHLLTLEQYASLSVELTLWPRRSAATLARYGVADLSVLRRHWDPVIARDPSQRQRYAKACADYRRWLATRKG